MTTDNELVERLRARRDDFAAFPEADPYGLAHLLEEAAAALEAAGTIQTRIEGGRPADGGQPALAATQSSPQAVSPLTGFDQAQEDQSVCMDCGGINPVWFAPNDLWNLVIGGPEAKGDPGGFYCPVCFIVRAEVAGIRPTAWVLTQERISSEEQAEEVARIIDPEAFAFNGDSDSYKAKFEIPARKRAATAKALAALALTAPPQSVSGMREALRSIAANTCCDQCQEAALVARAALAASPPTPQVDAGEVLRAINSIERDAEEIIRDHDGCCATVCELAENIISALGTLRAARSLADKLGREG